MTTPHTPTPPSAPFPPARPRPIILSDLTDDLLWPRLLRSGVLALRPGRLFLATLAVIAVSLIARIPMPWGSDPSLTLKKAWATAATRVARDALVDGVRTKVLLDAIVTVGTPLRLVRESPWVAVFFGLPCAIILALTALAISRSAAVEWTRGAPPDLLEMVHFARRRALSCLAAMISPLLLAALLIGGLALLGMILLGLPVINILGALLYPLGLLIAAAVVVLLAVYALGFLLIPPALACEGSDAIDATQRVFAYVAGRPLRLLLYALVLILQLWILGTLAELLAQASVDLMGFAASAGLSESAREAVSGKPDGGIPALVRWMIERWNMLPGMIADAFTLSFVACAGSVLYLLLRRVNDAQDESEVWMPSDEAAIDEKLTRADA